MLTYAEDTTIGTSSHYIDTLVETLTTDLQTVLSWYNSNNMSLNVYKLNLCISHLDINSKLANCDHDISKCDSRLQVSCVGKLLGVTISNTLCWDAHIDHLIKQFNSYLFYCQLEGTEYCFTTLIFYLIFISVLLSANTFKSLYLKQKRINGH